MTETSDFLKQMIILKPFNSVFCVSGVSVGIAEWPPVRERSVYSNYCLDLS